jgi:hypothetical protein
MTMPASGIRKSPREWLTTEDAALTRLFNAGAQLPEMRAALPNRTDSQIRRHLTHLKLKRDTPLAQRNSWVWGAMQLAIREHGPMTAAELEERTKGNHACVLRQLKRYHGNGLYVSEWRPTLRKPAAVWALGNESDADRRAALARQPVKRRVAANPFAAAAGLIKPVGTVRGRVFKHLHDDEREAA